jgi:hypothetical protein
MEEIKKGVKFAEDGFSQLQEGGKVQELGYLLVPGLLKAVNELVEMVEKDQKEIDRLKEDVRMVKRWNNTSF